MIKKVTNKITKKITKATAQATIRKAAIVPTVKTLRKTSIKVKLYLQFKI